MRATQRVTSFGASWNGEIATDFDLAVGQIEDHGPWYSDVFAQAYAALMTDAYPSGKILLALFD